MDNPYDQGNTGGTPEGTGTAARMKQTLQDAASQATNKIADLGRRTVSQIDSTREPIADTLDKSAAWIDPSKLSHEIHLFPGSFVPFLDPLACACG